MPDISLIVHTHNSAATLPELLASTSWIGDRLIVDQGSMDGTQDLASAAGCTVVRQETSGVDASGWMLPKTRWTLAMEPDEHLSADAEHEISKLIDGLLNSFDAIAFPRYNYIAGHLLTAPRWYPDHQTRLFRSERIPWASGQRPPTAFEGRSERTFFLPPPNCLHIHRAAYRDLYDFVERQVNSSLKADYEGTPNFHQNLLSAYEELEATLSRQADGDISMALSILASWDHILRGVLHWDAGGRQEALGTAFTLPLYVESADPAEVLRLRQKLVDLERSNSWRLTRPIRWTVAKLRSLIGRR